MLTADGQHVATHDDDGALTVLRTADGEHAAVPPEVRGVPLSFTGGGFAVWTKPKERGGDGHIVRWSPGAAAATATFVVPPYGPELAPPRSSRNGRFVVRGGAVRDLLLPGMPARPVAEGTTVVPSGSGAFATIGRETSCFFGQPTQCTIGLFATDGATLGQHRLDGGARACGFSPDDAHVAVLTVTGLLVFDGRTGAVAARFAGNWQDVAWLDANCLITGGANALTLLCLDGVGSMVTTPVPGQISYLDTDADGRRAVATLRDRALLVRIERGGR